MRFTGINEYFYKTYSSVMILLIPPMLAFIVLYFQPPIAPVSFDDDPQTMSMLVGFVALTWALAFGVFGAKNKSARNGPGLRRKLEKYFQITIVRYTLFCLTGLVLAGGFFFFRSDVFTMIYVVQLVVSALLWPGPGKVTRDLRLRGDEYEMVFFQRDVL
jgi:hypothetical protein